MCEPDKSGQFPGSAARHIQQNCQHPWAVVVAEVSPLPATMRHPRGTRADDEAPAANAIAVSATACATRTTAAVR